MKNNKTTQQIFLSLIGLLLLIFSGCSIISLDKKEPEKKYFSFSQTNNLKQTTKSKSFPTDLILMGFTAASEFKTNQFIYKNENQYIKDYYNRFFLPPEKMIQKKCTGWLKNTGLFKNVSTKSRLSLSDFILKGKLLEIYCDRTSISTAFAIIKIRFNLIEYNKTDKTIMEKDLHSRVEFKHFSADNLINAWTKCLEDIFQNLESEIISSI